MEHSMFLIYKINDTHTKWLERDDPSTKRPKLKIAQNERSTHKMAQGTSGPNSKRPILKMAQTQNGPNSKRTKLKMAKAPNGSKQPMAQNGPRYKIAHIILKFSDVRINTKCEAISYMYSSLVLLNQKINRY
jgi:hypothetical protein